MRGRWRRISSPKAPRSPRRASETSSAFASDASDGPRRGEGGGGPGRLPGGSGGEDVEGGACAGSAMIVGPRKRGPPWIINARARNRVCAAASAQDERVVDRERRALE